MILNNSTCPRSCVSSVPQPMIRLTESLPGSGAVVVGTFPTLRSAQEWSERTTMKLSEAS